MIRPRASAAACRGSTLLELTLVIAVLSLLLFVTFSSLVTAQSSVSLGLALWDVEGGAARAVSFMAERLRQSGTMPEAGMSLDQPASGGFRLVRFRTNRGFDLVTGTVRWSEPRELGFAYELGEVGGGTPLVDGERQLGWIDAEPNGIDDDGDGLVDEGVLYYRTTDAMGTPILMVIATGVLPGSGMQFSSLAGATTPDPGGDVVHIHLEVARRAPDAAADARVDVTPGDFIISRLDRAVVPRNSIR